MGHCGWVCSDYYIREYCHVNVASEYYTYDANGSLTQDQNKGLAHVHRNHLNLPDSIAFDNNRWMRYVYDAAGIKLMRITYDSLPGSQDTTHYVGGFHYQGSVLEFFFAAETKISVQNDTLFSRTYFFKDHLNNIRGSFMESMGEAILLESSHYYPFGKAITELIYQSSPNAANEYLFLGKQDQKFNNLNFYHIEARFYDPNIARWGAMDVKADSYADLSHYSYSANQPISLADYNGKELTQSMRNRIGLLFMVAAHKQNQLDYEIWRAQQGDTGGSGSGGGSGNKVGNLDKLLLAKQYLDYSYNKLKEITRDLENSSILFDLQDHQEVVPQMSKDRFGNDLKTTRLGWVTVTPGGIEGRDVVTIHVKAGAGLEVFAEELFEVHLYLQGKHTIAASTTKYKGTDGESLPNGVGPNLFWDRGDELAAKQFAFVWKASFRYNSNKPWRSFSTVGYGKLDSYYSRLSKDDHSLERLLYSTTVQNIKNYLQGWANYFDTTIIYNDEIIFNTSN